MPFVSLLSGLQNENDAHHDQDNTNEAEPCPSGYAKNQNQYTCCDKQRTGNAQKKAVSARIFFLIRHFILSAMQSNHLHCFLCEEPVIYNDENALTHLIFLSAEGKMKRYESFC